MEQNSPLPSIRVHSPQSEPFSDGVLRNIQEENSNVRIIVMLEQGGLREGAGGQTCLAGGRSL